MFSRATSPTPVRLPCTATAKGADSLPRFARLHAAVTDWIERLASSSYKVTEYEGIPELVEAINLQHTGCVRPLRVKPALDHAETVVQAIGSRPHASQEAQVRQYAHAAASHLCPARLLNRWLRLTPVCSSSNAWSRTAEKGPTFRVRIRFPAPALFAHTGPSETFPDPTLVERLKVKAQVLLRLGNVLRGDTRLWLETLRPRLL